MHRQRHSARAPTRSAGARMSLVLDHDRAALSESYDWLQELTLSEFRGRGDTLGAARARLSKRIGLRVSYADRLWNKAKDMTGVAGGAYRALKLAYEASCQRIEDRGDFYRSQREGLRDGLEASEGRRADGVALADVDPPHPSAPAARPEGPADG